MAKIGTLAGDLEVEVLFTIVLLRERSVCERIGSVVTIDQVLDDLFYVSDVASVLDLGTSDEYGARFPESNASVGIIDGWNAATRKVHSAWET